MEEKHKVAVKPQGGFGIVKRHSKVESANAADNTKDLDGTWYGKGFTTFDALDSTTGGNGYPINRELKDKKFELRVEEEMKKELQAS